jgi:predicted nucleic acid-binding Zn ribbon protein
LILCSSLESEKEGNTGSRRDRNKKLIIILILILIIALEGCWMDEIEKEGGMTY